VKGFMASGTSLFTAAQAPDDFRTAAAEVEKATLAAPWLAEAYYNLGSAQEKAGLLYEAAASLRLYLLAAPKAPDAKLVGAHLSGLQQGLLRQSLADLQKRPDDLALRQKIIKLALVMNPPPAIPEEAKRLVDRGMAAVQGAGSADDFKDAAAEFAKASLAAPWVANVYSNLGVVQDKVGLYTEAISSLNLYLLAAPNAPDAEATKSLIHQIEYRREKAAGEARAAAAKQAEDERQKRAQQVRNTSFEGRWANLDLIDYRTGLPHPGNDIIIDRDSSGNLRVKQQDGGGGLNQGEGVHLDGNKLTYTLANYISTWRVELALSPDGTNLFKTSTYLGQNEEQRRNAPGLIIDQPVEHHQYRRSE